MQGLELSKQYYNAFGAPMLHEKFSQYEGIIAVGLCGSGSECFGFDDSISCDHDFEPGFCMFLPDSENLVSRKTEFLLERAYNALPNEFMGYKRLKLPPFGGSRHGVMRMGNFFEAKTGKKDGSLGLYDWFSVPSSYLAEATNGEVFRDDLGEFSAIRCALLNMPHDAALKLIAGRLFIMGQSGQYNYSRCIAHGEAAAAQSALYEFANSAISLLFILNSAHMPFYKWAYRALRELNNGESYAQKLEYLISTDNTPINCEKKQRLINEICADASALVHSKGFCRTKISELIKLAFDVNSLIADNELRNRDVLFAV